MAEIVFDPNEYLRTVASTVPRTAEMFQEGQKAAADIAMSQYQQQAYEQANRFREMEQPYRMANLQNELADYNRKRAAQEEYLRGGTGMTKCCPTACSSTSPAEPPSGCSSCRRASMNSFCPSRKKNSPAWSVRHASVSTRRSRVSSGSAGSNKPIVAIASKSAQR